MKNKVNSIFQDILVILTITLFLFFLAEGFSSIVILFHDFTEHQTESERLHTEYDSLLGWINKPNIFIQNIYGPGKDLRTNSQRFRNNRDFTAAVPNGKKRWICAGDSFTLGYGVDNDDSWCSLLASKAPDIETVNMGQGGYGIDQAYLWYMRDGVRLDHDVLIFAFITPDFYRMNSGRFMGYSKPRLSVLNGKIIQGNVPVPRPGLFAGHIPRLKLALGKLSVVKLMSSALNRIKDNTPETESKMNESEMSELIISIISDLYDSNRRPARTVFLVHLPMSKDYKTSHQSDFWRNFLHSHAKKNGWIYIDLIEDLRNLNPESMSNLFIQEDLPGLVNSAGHYNENGNQYIADLIVKKIARSLSVKDPELTSE